MSHSNGRYTIGNSRPLLRWIVSTCTASASDSRRRLRSSSPFVAGLVDPRRSHAVSAVTPSCSASPRHAGAGRCGAGRSSGARRRRRRGRLGEPLGGVIVSSSAATPRVAQHARPVVQAPVNLLPRAAVVAAAGDQALGGPAEEAGERRRCGRGELDAGRSSASSSRSHSRRDLAREHASRAVDHGRHAGRVERLAHDRRSGCCGPAPRDRRARSVRPAPFSRRTRQQRDDIARRGRRRLRARALSDLRVAAVGQREPGIIARHVPDAQRRAAGSTYQPRPPVASAARTSR